MRFISESSQSCTWLKIIVRLNREGYPLVRKKNQKFDKLGERWLKSGMGKKMKESDKNTAGNYA